MISSKKIAIIGCGHIGKLLAQRLNDKKRPVHGYVSSESSVVECSRRHITCSIVELDRPHCELDLTSHDIIYLVPPPRAGKIDTRMTNFIRAIENHRPERFVLISTTGVYGDCQGAWVDESTPLNPLADRAFRRADAERQAQTFCQRHDIPLTILRVPGIYGPGKIPAARITSGKPIVSQQDSPFTNRIHADDLVTICETALLDDRIAGIYNVSDGTPGTMYEYFIAVAATMGLPVPPVISLSEASTQLSEGMLSYMAESRRIDNSKLLKDFDITLKYPTLLEGLDSIRKDHASNEID